MQLSFLLMLTFVSLMIKVEPSRVSTLSVNTTEITDCSQMQKVRDIYHNIQTSEQLEDFIKYLDKLDCEMIDPYRASAIMQKAQYSFWPNQKFSYFSKGKNALETFIQKHPNNVEGRYVRLLVQSELPGFLGYKDNIMADAEFIISQVGNSELPTDYQIVILNNVNKILKKEKE